MCYKCGAIACDGEPWIHYNNIPTCSNLDFERWK